MAGSASASSGSVEWAAVEPQQIQSFNSGISSPSLAAAATTTNYTPPFDAAAAGLKPLFDGKTLNGWVGDPACWKVVDGAIVGVKGNQNLMTAGDYDDFRLIVSSVQVKEASNHQGVGFWGAHMPDGKYGYGGCLDIMPPMNWMWDYTRNSAKSGNLPSAETSTPKWVSNARSGRRRRFW